MAARREDSFEIRLKNAEGVPILQIGGMITETALKAVKFTMDRLAGAGHYHVVLNIENAQASNWRFLIGLAESVRNIRAHYGAVDLVATQERIQQLVGIDQLPVLFRFCRSEAEAILRIKKLLRQPDGIADTNARLLEKP